MTVRHAPVRRQSSHRVGPPHFDGAVLGGRVEQACATPADARDGACVTGQGQPRLAQHHVPDAHGAVLAAAREPAALSIPAKNDKM